MDITDPYFITPPYPSQKEEEAICPAGQQMEDT